MHADPSSRTEISPTPKTILVSGCLSTMLGTVGMVFGLFVAGAAVMGRHFTGLSLTATAVAFVVLGGALAAAGVGLLRGKTWGRSFITLLCLMLIPISYGIITDSGQPQWGYPLGAVVAINLVCLFMPVSVRWATENRTF